MASKEYTDEELNYFRVCHVATCEIPNGLRDVFKQEWDTRYATSHGKWQDTAKNGTDFAGMEKPTRHNAQTLANIRNGNTLEWDCTTLFYAIVYSNCISHRYLNPVFKTKVHDLRNFRNNAFAHVAAGKLSNANFQSSMQNVIDAFQDLKLDTAKIQQIKNQPSFPTDELQKVHQLLEKERKQNEEPHPFCNLPPKPSYDPIERTAEVTRIEGEMRRLKDKYPSEVTVCYISGNPGCGKSELARQIGQRFFDKNAPATSTKEVTFVNTLNASSIDTLLQSYTELAKCLNFDEDAITRIGTSKDLSLEEKVIHLRSLIAPRVQKYSSWLMIVDNVTDLKSISKHLWQAGDKTNGKGQILVTTQDSRSIPQDSYTYHESLSTGMSETDSIKVLHEISGLLEEKTTLQVAKALDFQPLALACAATYVLRVRNINPSFTWQNYLRKLEEGKREATEKVYKETSLTYPNTMITAVRIAVEKERSDDVIMKLAFEFLSALAPEPIPLKYVVSYVMSCTHGEDEDLVAFKISSSSLVLYSSETQEIRVHQVIHSCLSTSKNANVSRSQLLLVINAFSPLISFDPEDIDEVVATRSLAVHIVTLEKNVKDCLRINELSLRSNMADIFISMGEVCCTHGCYQCAKTFYDLALPSFLTNPLTRNIKASSICNMLANVLRQLGQYNKAKTYLENALSMHNDTSEVTTMRHLAAVYIDLGEYNKSKEYAEKALEIQGKQGDKTNASFAATLNCLGKALIYLGNYKEATKQLEKAFDIQEMIYSTCTNHPAMVPTLQNLANALYEMGKYQQAIDYSKRALDIQNHVFHERHPALATTLTSFANTLHYMGRYEEALKMMETVLDIKKEAYVENHPIFAPTYLNLANILRDLKRYQDAKMFLKKALDIQTNTFGENHPEIALTLNSMANVLNDASDWEEDGEDVALSHLERALNIQEKVYSKTHPELAITLNNLGNIYMKPYKKDLDEAERCLNRSLEIKQKTYDENHPSIAKSLNNLAMLLVKQEKYYEAKLHLEKALSIQERAYDGKHPLISITLFNLAQTLKELGDDEGATQYRERAEIICPHRVFLPKCADIICCYTALDDDGTVDKEKKWQHINECKFVAQMYNDGIDSLMIGNHEVMEIKFTFMWDYFLTRRRNIEEVFQQALHNERMVLLIVPRNINTFDGMDCLRPIFWSIPSWDCPLVVVADKDSSAEREITKTFGEGNSFLFSPTAGKMKVVANDITSDDLKFKNAWEASKTVLCEYRNNSEQKRTRKEKQKVTGKTNVTAVSHKESMPEEDEEEREEKKGEKEKML